MITRTLLSVFVFLLSFIWVSLFLCIYNLSYVFVFVCECSCVIHANGSAVYTLCTVTHHVVFGISTLSVLTLTYANKMCKTSIISFEISWAKSIKQHIAVYITHYTTNVHIYISTMDSVYSLCFIESKITYITNQVDL